MKEKIKTEEIIVEKPLLLTVSCYISFFINSLLIISGFIGLFSISFLKNFTQTDIRPEHWLLVIGYWLLVIWLFGYWLLVIG